MVFLKDYAIIKLDKIGSLSSCMKRIFNGENVIMRQAGIA